MVSIHKCDASILDEGAKICKKKRVNMNEGRQTWGYVRLWTCVVCQDSTPDLLWSWGPRASSCSEMLDKSEGRAKRRDMGGSSRGVLVSSYEREVAFRMLSDARSELA